MTTPIEGTTPRPWRTNGYNVVGANDRTTADCRYKNGFADAALIVAAVNDYDRLRAIEDAARAVCTDWGGDPDFGAALDRLVEALR